MSMTHQGNLSTQEPEAHISLPVSFPGPTQRPPVGSLSVQHLKKMSLEESPGLGYNQAGWDVSSSGAH